MDSAESFYHGFMAGVLSRLKGYRVKSNRESGHGRSDLVMYSVDMRGKAIIFELKQAGKFKEMVGLCDDALRQIEANDYAAYWDDEGYVDIMKYGIAFYRKNCEVRMGEAPPKKNIKMTQIYSIDTQVGYGTLNTFTEAGIGRF